MLQVVRSQMMDDEAEVPWDAVHSFWRSRRSRWRQVKPHGCARAWLDVPRIGTWRKSTRLAAL